MTYGIGIGFPVEPTKEDLKKIKRDLAYESRGYGGKTSQTSGADKQTTAKD